MDRGHFTPCVLRGPHSSIQQTPFTRSSSDSLWKSPLQQQPALFQECFPFLHLNSLKSPPWGIVKGKEKERQGEEEEEEVGGTTKHSREDRKPLDGEDGKFRQCGPIFNSGFQATDE